MPRMAVARKNTRTLPGARGWTAALVFGAGSLAAQAPEGDEGIERLQGILATPVIAATRRSVPIRETPGIVSVLDREEIRASGARDLLDLLRMVPGLDFGSDTNGVLGIGVRGNWGHDGKVLLLIDGLEMNEPLYGTLQFGGHYPLGGVERVEIIRGPGSATYGGYAELAVINVITRSGRDLDGFEGSLRLGRMAGADLLGREVHAGFGRSWGLQAFSVAYDRGDAPAGSGPWPTAQGIVASGDASHYRTDMLNLAYTLGDLHVRYLRDGYYLDDFTRESKRGTAANSFPGEFLGVDYTLGLGDLTLKPEFTLKQQSPWNYTDARTDRDTRGVARILATWKVSPALGLALGAEATQDDANIFWSSRNVRETYVYQNKAALLQVLWSAPFGNLDLGLRTDHNSEFGSTTSPRFAFTHAEAGWHVKILASGAFRAPSIENLFVNPALKPERTRSAEAEVGFTLSRHSYLSVNVFSERISDPISYANPTAGHNTYLNFDQVGSRGVELDFQAQYPQGSVRSTFTWQEATDREAAFYAVPGEPSYHVGFPLWKATILAQWRFLPGWSFNPGLMALGPRYAYEYAAVVPTRKGASAILDLYLTRRISGALEAGLRVSNAGNARILYIQPYGFPGVGGNPPLPGPGREVELRVTFAF